MFKRRDTAGQERYKVCRTTQPLSVYLTSYLAISLVSCTLRSPSPRVYSAKITQAPMYYRNANCAVVVYDITQTASLEKARTWIRELQRQADPSIVIALCGNKSDLSARRQVSEEEAKKYAEEEGLMWAETSAKSGEGVTEIFTAIGKYTKAHHSTFMTLNVYLSQEAAPDRTSVSKGRRRTSCVWGKNRCGS
jgi:GTPase SAR1 family protein